RQHRNVKSVFCSHGIRTLFRLSQQIQQQRSELGANEELGNGLVSPAEATASAAVHEDNDATCLVRDAEVPVEQRTSRVNPDRTRSYDGHLRSHATWRLQACCRDQRWIGGCTLEWRT